MANLIIPKKAEDYYSYHADDDPDPYVMIFRAHIVVWDTSTDLQFIRPILVEDVHIEKAIKQINKIIEIQYNDEKMNAWIIAIEQTGEVIARIG